MHRTAQLKNAVITISPTVPEPMRTTVVKVLQEEVSKRTGSAVKKVSCLTKKAATRLLLLYFRLIKNIWVNIVPVSADAEAAEYKKEGYRIVSANVNGQSVTWIIGADTRGVLFGAGWLLRNLKMENRTLVLEQNINVATSPMYPIRGTNWDTGIPLTLTMHGR